MSLLKTIFRVFKSSALYDSYSDEQRNAVDKICEIHTKNNSTNGYYTEYDKNVLGQLEKIVTRRVLSASIPVRKVIKLLRNDHLRPGELELVNVIDDIEEDQLLGDFLNLFVEKSNRALMDDVNQLKHFPAEAIEYLTDENKVKVSNILQ